METSSVVVPHLQRICITLYVPKSIMALCYMKAKVYNPKIGIRVHVILTEYMTFLMITSIKFLIQEHLYLNCSVAGTFLCILLKKKTIKSATTFNTK